MNLVIFEDEFTDNLYPFSLIRPVFEMKCGMFTLKDRILNEFDKPDLILQMRNYLVSVVRDDYPGIKINNLSIDNNKNDYIFINGALVFNSEYKNTILSHNNTIFLKNGRVLAANIKGKISEIINKDNVIEKNNPIFKDLKPKEVNFKYINYWWDLVQLNSELLVKDFEKLDKKDVTLQDVYKHTAFVNEKNIYVGRNVKIKPGVVLDAEDGPICIDNDAKIMPHATIVGPVYIGRGSKINPAARILEGTTIGEVCKVGGEVEESIIHSYSNKQHDGFLGHSYLGQWVNLGADTNNSDLKNNYSSVKVNLNGRKIDTGSMFVGLAMGDHSKSGINTMFNTGTAVGISCNIYGAGFPPKHIPSFSWGGAEGFVEYDLEKAISTAKAVMKRRKIEMTENMENLFRYIFEMTRKGRKDY